jgi:hypothetical protein
VRGAVLALAFAIVTLATDARGEDALPLELEWEAPPECASAEKIRSELTRIAHVRPGRTVAPLMARGRIEKASGSYRLSLHTEQGGVAGERTLVANDCRALEREVTLVLAVAFGEGVELVSEEEREPSQIGATPGAPTQKADGEPSPVERPTKTAPKPSSPPAASVPASPVNATSPSGERLRAAALAGGGAFFGTLPSPAGFATAGAMIGGRRFWLDARLLWIPRVEQALPRGVRARYQGFGGALSGCAAIPAAPSVSTCLSLTAAALSGRSSGATESVQSIAPLFSVAPTIGWQIPSRGALSLRLEAALHVALSKPQFVVIGLGEGHRVPLLSASLDVVVAFSPGR